MGWATNGKTLPSALNKGEKDSVIIIGKKEENAFLQRMSLCGLGPARLSR